MATLIAVLEYCGGKRTDALVRQLREWNPGYAIEVLDNASPCNKCTCATRTNSTNSFVGGGIRDCFELAKANGFSNLFYLANDVIPIMPIIVERFDEILQKHPDIVQLSAALSAESAQATDYPWMIFRKSATVRFVPHADIICGLFRTTFIQSFGGFPISKGGWGYDWEIAYHARLRGFKIGIADWCAVEHPDDTSQDATAGSPRDKRKEMDGIYKNRYGHNDWLLSNTLAELWRHQTGVPEGISNEDELAW